MSESKRELREQLRAALDRANRIDRIRSAEQAQRMQRFEKTLAELHPRADAPITIITPSGALLTAMIIDITIDQDLIDVGDRKIGGMRHCEIRLAPQPYER